MVMVGLSQDQWIFGPWVVLTDGSTTHAHTLAFYLYMQKLKKEGFTRGMIWKVAYKKLYLQLCFITSFTLIQLHLLGFNGKQGCPSHHGTKKLANINIQPQGPFVCIKFQHNTSSGIGPRETQNPDIIVQRGVKINCYQTSLAASCQFIAKKLSSLWQGVILGHPLCGLHIYVAYVCVMGQICRLHR